MATTKKFKRNEPVRVKSGAKFHFDVAYFKYKDTDNFVHLEAHVCVPVDSIEPIPPEESDLKCNFCLSPDTSVQRLVAGRGVSICNECIGICVEILKDQSVVST